MAKKRYDDFSVKYTLAAPCGMYCGNCRQYLAERTGLKIACEGCRIRNKNCAFIRKDCPPLRKGTIRFCYECDRMPCDKLKKIDALYTKRYGTSFVGNLERMESIGVDAWLDEQREKWRCPACGGRLCIHDAKCVDCGAPLRK
jgi:hypothetical protein